MVAVASPLAQSKRRFGSVDLDLDLGPGIEVDVDDPVAAESA